MDTLETKRLEMFGRVRSLGAEHTAQFPEGSYGEGLFKRLDTIIKGLEEYALRQSTGQSSVREVTTSKAAVRDEIRRRLDAISRTARIIAYTSPGLEDKFRVPRSIGDQALLQLARTFASDAAPLKDEFTRRGLAATFIEDLGHEADVFGVAINQKAQGRSTHVAASAEIDDLVEQGIRTVREIDTLVRNTFADDPATLAAWESASHVERRGSRHAKTKSAEKTGTPASE